MNSVVEVDKTTRELLSLYAGQYENEAFFKGDPSWWMHQVSGVDNQEAMAFLASCLSYGSREQFMSKIGKLLEWSEGDVDGWVRSGEYADRFMENDSGCFYRLYSKSTMRKLLDAYRRLLAEYGTMGNYVQNNATDGLGAVQALCRFFAEHDASAVVPHDAKSACKRLCMFLRWMVRDNSPVDLGLWAGFIDRRTLVMPMDTHVMRQSVRLGLLKGSTASMSAALRLTATLATVFPDDPLKGDFALFGYGVAHKK